MRAKLPDRRSILALAVLLGAMTTPADAAGRTCLPPISVEAVHPGTAVDARREALVLWKAAAARHGEQWASWRLSTPRVIHCAAVKNGFRCQILAAPCTLARNAQLGERR